MVITKRSFITVFFHHMRGFNTHNNFLKSAVEQSGEKFSEHDIDSIKICLNNMKEQIANVEKYIADHDTLSNK